MRVGLIRHPETEPPCLGGRTAPPPAASDLDCPLVRMDEAAGDPQQCRFPGPVLPDERVNLARVAVDANVPQRLYRSERFRHAAQGQHGGARGPGNRHDFGSSGAWFLPRRGTSGGAGSAGSVTSPRHPADSPWCTNHACPGPAAGSGTRSWAGSSRPSASSSRP